MLWSPIDHVMEEHSNKGNPIQFGGLATQWYLDYNIAPCSHHITKIMQLYYEAQFHTTFEVGGQGTDMMHVWESSRQVLTA